MLLGMQEVASLVLLSDANSVRGLDTKRTIRFAPSSQNCLLCNILKKITALSSDEDASGLGRFCVEGRGRSASRYRRINQLLEALKAEVWRMSCPFLTRVMYGFKTSGVFSVDVKKGISMVCSWGNGRNG